MIALPQARRAWPLTLVILLFFCQIASAQLAVTGTVRDADAGDTLPLATIQVDGSGQHAVTNADGQFRISVSAFPVTLLVRHIGYHSARVTVAQRTNEDIEIRMDPVIQQLDEVVVSGEDPAVGIMREVIARKAEWRDSVTTTYAEVYTRFWLFSLFTPVLMEESLRSTYWREDGGSREIVQARRTRPPRIKTLRFASAGYVPNFYDDSVILLGSVYAAPTHPNALDYYEFRLGGKRMLDDGIVWDIYFTPKSSTRPAFTGHAAVLDSAFVIFEIDLRPHPGIVVTPPANFHDVQFEQRFGRLRGGVMMPLNLTARGMVEFGRLGASNPPARYEQYSSVSNYVFDAPSPDSLYADDKTQRMHPLADQSDFFFNRNPTMTPMTPHELEALAGINPQMTIDRAFRASGMLAGYAAVELTEKSESEEEEEPPHIVGRLMKRSWLWYNRVDGWHVGLQDRFGLSTGTLLTTKLAYTSDRHRFATVLGLEQPFAVGGNTISILAQISDETRPTFDSDLYGLFLPGMMTYAGYPDYYDYYRRRAIKFGTSFQGSGGLAATVAVNYEKHSSQENNTNDRGWLVEREQRPNPTIDDGILTSIGGELRFGDTRNHVGFDIEHAGPYLQGSEFDFTTVRGNATVHIKTLFRDRERPNVLRLDVIGGAGTGSIPLQRSGVIQGSTGPVALSGSFRTLGNRAMTGSEYAAAFVEHDFTTAIAEALHLWRLADSGMGFVVFGGAGKVFSGSPVYEAEGWRYEAGIGLSHFFRLPIRLDLGWRLDAPEYSFRLGKAIF